MNMLKKVMLVVAAVVVVSVSQCQGMLRITGPLLRRDLTYQIVQMMSAESRYKGWTVREIQNYLLRVQDAPESEQKRLEKLLYDEQQVIVRERLARESNNQK